MRVHYEALDGLRGTAAISVVAFHLFELMVPDLDHNPMPHTFLAVDFFYALSGYVLGYAYDHRLSAAAAGERLSFWGFIRRRLIRLHPAVVMAACVALCVYLLDPNIDRSAASGVPYGPGRVALVFLLTMFLLPAPNLPGLFGDTHPLNPPSWSLMWEYIANLFYVTVGYRLRRCWHILLLAAGAVALTLTAQFYKGDLGYGWGWPHVWVAPIRLCYPFLAGLLVYRLKWKLVVPQPFLVASAILLAVFLAPRMGAYNGLFEAACVIFVFPVLLMIGAGVGAVQGLSGPLCRYVGTLSYPLYIVHYQFIFLFGHWNWSTNPPKPLLHAVAAGAFLFLIALGTLFAYAFDKPVRARLAKYAGR